MYIRDIKNKILWHKLENKYYLLTHSHQLYFLNTYILQKCIYLSFARLLRATCFVCEVIVLKRLLILKERANVGFYSRLPLSLIRVGSFSGISPRLSCINPHLYIRQKNVKDKIKRKGGAKRGLDKIHVLTQCSCIYMQTELKIKKLTDCQRQINRKVDYSTMIAWWTLCVKMASRCQTRRPFISKLFLSILYSKYVWMGKIVKKIKLDKINKLKFNHIIYNCREINESNNQSDKKCLVLNVNLNC